MAASSHSSATVSVVIPTYQRAQMVERALESVYSQTLAPDEVLVVDDGSSDGTAEMLAARFPRTRVLRRENGGVSAARNSGIRESSGDWIALLDSDDEWAPTKLERQLELLERRAGRVCHCDEIWIREGRRVNPRHRHAKFGGWIYRRCLPLCCISPSAVVIHRSVFETVGLFEETLPVCEDYDLWLRITARYPVLFVAEPLVVKHGGHADQLSSSFWGMDRFRVRALERAWRLLDLVPSQRIATLQMLVEKLEILAAGARKRSRAELVGSLEVKLGHFEHLLRLERMTL